MRTGEVLDRSTGIRSVTQVLRPPLRDRKFWWVQGGVLTLAVIHDVVLVNLHAHYLAGVPAPTTSGLLLVPVIYAALNFGVRGAVGTALWATILIFPHWFLVSDPSPGHVWIEVGYLVILNVVAVVVGQRVEREQRARHRAETALRAAKDAEARYYTLFEEQPAPVIVTNAEGVVAELNTAATRLLPQAAAGRHLDDLLGVDATELFIPEPRWLRLGDQHGRQLLLVPRAHRVTTTDGTELIQVILTDVTEQHRRQEEQRLFAGRLLHVQEEERLRLAHELHDAPLQDLAYLTRTLDDLSHSPGLPDPLPPQLQHTAAVATEAATALRKTIHGLRPPVLDDLGLVSALRQLVQDARLRTGLRVGLRVNGGAIRLSPELELACYRIAQEALNNAIRHARASRIGVAVTFGDEVVLSITDNGRGIDAGDSPPQSGSGLGLIGMRERVNMAGGSLLVTPHRPHGIRVRATLPLLSSPDPRTAPEAEPPAHWVAPLA